MKAWRPVSGSPQNGDANGSFQQQRWWAALLSHAARCAWWSQVSLLHLPCCRTLQHPYTAVVRWLLCLAGHTRDAGSEAKRAEQEKK